MISTSDGRTIPGYAIYNLYQRDDNPDASELVVDYPVDFFMGVHELRLQTAKDTGKPIQAHVGFCV